MVAAVSATAVRTWSTVAAGEAVVPVAGAVAGVPATREAPPVIVGDAARTASTGRGLGRDAAADAIAASVLPAIVIAWLIGVAVLVGRMAGGLWYVERVRRAALAAPASSWQAACLRLGERLRSSAPVRVVESMRVDVPAVVGWLRPVILLPAAAVAHLSPEQVEAILAHELAHVVRHDYLVNVLQSVVETLLFFHPAAWWVSSRIRVEREHCCDEIAVEACGDAFLYARALAGLEAARVGDAGLALAATGGSLVDRIRRILREPVNDQPRVAGWTITLVLTLAAAVGLSAAMQTPAVPVPAVPPVPPAAPVTHDWAASWRDGLRHVEAHLNGSVAFNDDLTDVVSLSPGGSLTLRDWHFLIPYTVELRESGGTITRRYYVTGTERPWDADASALLADNLGWLVRRSALGAPSRVARLLATGGPDAVFGEIGRLETDYARRVYLQELLAQAHPQGEVFVRVLQAAQALSSSYDLGQILRATAAQAAGDAPAVAAWMAGANRVRSDYEHRRALEAFAEAPAFGPAIAGPAIRSAAALRSDYEKGVALRGMAGAAADPAVAAIYLDAARTMRSDYERRRVLTTLVDQGSIAAGTAAEVARAARGLRSDYEKGTALRAVAPFVAGEALAGQAYVDAAGTIRSDYERRRALEALTATAAATDQAAGLPGNALLLAARGISSDQECARLLMEFVDGGGLDTGSSDAFFGTLGTIQSSVSRRRVLGAVIARDGIDAGVMAPLLDAVRATASDNARADLLVALVERHGSAAVDREAFLRAASSIASTHDQNRALTAFVRN
jgi:beta-lactamase regulating signal transducer with metallopeptidase domain